jgi:hypothetical protein
MLRRDPTDMGIRSLEHDALKAHPESASKQVRPIIEVLAVDNARRGRSRFLDPTADISSGLPRPLLN